MSKRSDSDQIIEDGRWERIAFSFVLLLLFALAETLLWAMTLGQMVWTLFYGAPNEYIAEFGARLGVWAKRAVLYLSGTTDEKPFPWREID